MNPNNHSNSDFSSENTRGGEDTGNGINLSASEKKAKAQKVIDLFASGNRELARSILKSAKNEIWLFEELLLGCKIKDGKPIPSPLLKKVFDKSNTKVNTRLFKFTDGKQRYAILLMLDVMLCSPINIPSLASLDLNLISVLKFNRDETNLEWYYELIDHFPNKLVVEGDIDLTDLTELSDNFAKHLSKENADIYTSSLPMSDIGLTLPSLTNLSETAANYLSKYPGNLSLEGITTLSDNIMKILSEHKVLKDDSENLEDAYDGLFLGLTHLTDNAAKYLSSYQGDLGLYSLSTLSDTAAEALSFHEGELILSGLKNVSEKGLGFLKKHKKPINFSGLIEIPVSDRVKSINNFPIGNLSLNLIKNLNKEEAIFLCNSIKRELNLDGLTELNEDVAEILSQFNGVLSFRALKNITGNAAKALGNHKFELILGFESLPKDVADGLSHHIGGLVFYSLALISDESAEALGRTSGGLDFGKLLDVSEKGLHFLSKHEGNLTLDKLKTISDLGGEFLGKHEGGELSLNGIKLLSDIAALHLSCHNGEMFLRGIKELKDCQGHIALAKTLSNHKYESLYLNSLKILESGPSKSLSRYIGDLMLNNLNHLSDEAAIELTSFKGKELYLEGLKNPSDSLLQILSQCKCNLHLSSVCVLSIEVASSLSNHEGELHLDNKDLSMSDESAKLLSRHKGKLFFYRDYMHGKPYALEKKILQFQKEMKHE